MADSDGHISESVDQATEGLWSGTAGSDGCLPRVEGPGLEGEAFLVRRDDHLGLTLEERLNTLAFLLPQGTALYLGFFVDMPDRRGIGGVQLDLERLPVDRWISSTIGARGRRVIADSIVWPAEPGVPDDVTLTGWGLWDVVADGTLLRFDFLRTDGPEFKPVTFVLERGQSPGVSRGELGLIL